MKHPHHRVRLTGSQHKRLHQHLFPGDGLEAGALALCGWIDTPVGWTLCMHQVYPISYNSSERTEISLKFPVQPWISFFDSAAKNNLAILKIHSHPGGLREFSGIDEANDPIFFKHAHSWIEGNLPHVSAVMLLDGEIFARLYFPDGSQATVSNIIVAGDKICEFGQKLEHSIPDEQLRTMQAFGPLTTASISKLTVGVVGCSGTGSHIIEQMTRLGVKKMVIVDPKRMEKRNLNRIVGSASRDVQKSRTKTQMFVDHIEQIGLGTVVEAYAMGVERREAIEALACVDVIFGCTDNQTSRDILGKIAAHYIIPLVDVGVRLTADGNGGIKDVCGSVHYLTPDGPSLLDRGAISPDGLRAESLKRQTPGEYNKQLQEGYIRGAQVDSPAVIALNGMVASAGVMELLNRLHPYRDGNQENGSWLVLDLEGGFMHYSYLPTTSAYSRYVGLGSRNPLLSTPGLGI